MNQPEETELVPLTTSAAHDDHVDSEEQTPAILFPRHHRGPTTASDRPRGYWWTVLLLMVMTGGGGLLLILSSDPRSVPIAEAGRPLASNNETTLHYLMTASTQTQIGHYRRDGTALILNVHITHHAGTTFCAAVGRAPHTLGAPTFACMGVKPADNVTVTNYPSHRPWNYNETGPNVALVRPFFHMISWEFGWHHRPQPVLGQSTNWEHPQLVSVYISKHPLERMLSSGSHYFGMRYPGTRNGTADEMEWWRFAQDDWNNNYALHILSDSPACCDGANTTVADVVSAQALLRRFTFVLDVHCLDANLQELAAILGIELKESAGRKQHVHHKALAERIPYPEVYEYPTRRNQRDIELYEWSKGLSLVNCEALDTDHA